MRTRADTRPQPLRRPTVPPPQPLAPTPAGPGPDHAGPDPVALRLLDERVVLLLGEVDDAAAHRVVAQLLLLAAQDARRDITLYIDSPGGTVPAGLAIHDTMRLVGPDVATWAVGIAASTGQFLLSAGAPGKRHALPHARVLLHRPSPGLGGSAGRAGVLGEMGRELVELTARHTGQDVGTVTADSGRGRWFTAEQARGYGLVDHVVAG